MKTIHAGKWVIAATLGVLLAPFSHAQEAKKADTSSADAILSEIYGNVKRTFAPKDEASAEPQRPAAPSGTTTTPAQSETARRALPSSPPPTPNAPRASAPRATLADTPPVTGDSRARTATPSTGRATPAMSKPAGTPTPAAATNPPAGKRAPAGHRKPGSASWRKRYELGAGDVLNFGLSGKPKLVALQVPVAPDGTISYLQAKRVSVLGKTIAELRNEMQEVLVAYHRNPRLIITPFKLGSKKYTLLGQVKESGTFPLDRPMSLIEAIAKGKGIAVGVNDDSATELADFSRSFVVRGGKKINVDFTALYLRGDLDHNIQLEPNDYVYIASKVNSEFYVFGAVNDPGLKPLSGNFTVIGAISAAQGYSPKAWKKHVLLVRGSVSDPTVTSINTRDILKGRSNDIPLEPGDIVYVHNRPWAFAEELTDVAIKAFLDSVISTAIDPDRTAVSVGGN